MPFHPMKDLPFRKKYFFAGLSLSQVNSESIEQQLVKIV